MNYFRIFTEDWTELSVNARAVYAAISCKSDFNTRKSNVCRETISKFTGIKRLDSISTATNELVEKGWIVKNTLQVEPTKKLVVYQLIDRGRNKIISTSLLDEGLDTLYEVRKNINQKKFPRNEQFLCRYCTYSDICYKDSD